jgi:hypothetical protein
MNITLDNRMKVVAGFVLAGALTRLLPHPVNFTPIAAMALFGGTYLKDKKLAFLIPIGAMLLSDILLEIINGTGFHRTMIFVYGSMVISTMLGFFLRGREQRQTIMVASLTGSMLFFLITNFGEWLMQSTYPMTTAGLVDCYVKAIPFFRGTIMGDLFYNLVFFAGFAIVNKFVLSPVKNNR